MLSEAFDKLPISLWDIEPLPMGKEPLPLHIVQQLRQVGKTGKEQQGIVLDLPGNLLDGEFPLQQSRYLIAGEVIIPAGQPGNGGTHDTITGFLRPFLLTAPLGNHRGTYIEEGSKSGGAKADGGGKVKGEHKNTVFFVDVIFAFAVFIAQRDQRLRDPLTGIDEDLSGLGSLGEILPLHIVTSFTDLQCGSHPPH